MAEYAEREMNFNKSLGGVVAGFAAAIVDADSRAKDAHVDRIAKVLDADNVQFSASVSLIGPRGKARNHHRRAAHRGDGSQPGGDRQRHTDHEYERVGVAGKARRTSPARRAWAARARSAGGR